MTLPTQAGAYADCYLILDRALAAPNGIKAPAGNKGQAQYLQMRMYQARAIRRNLSRRAFPPTHHLWDTSDYDILIIRIRPAEDPNDPRWWIWVQPVALPDVTPYIEDLEPADRPALPGPNPYRARRQQLLIEGTVNDPKSSDLD